MGECEVGGGALCGRGSVMWEGERDVGGSGEMRLDRFQK